jgi:hypothetical protein
MVKGELDMTPADILARAEAAKRLFADPLLVEALATLESEVIEAFHACPVRDAEGMRILQSELRRCRKFKLILQGIIENGKLAANDLFEKENFIKQAARRFSS